MDILRILKAAPRKKNREEAAMLYTPWGSSLAANGERDIVRPEHPRPALARREILMLNGLWQCGITEMQSNSTSALNLDEVIVDAQTEYDREIVVPFSPEALLSRVNHILQPHEILWYKRSFICKPPQGKRALLHFDGVDWACACKVDGVVVGTHEGAYSPFVFDITNELVASDAECAIDAEGFVGAENSLSHTIELCVIDPTDTGVQLRGKQKLEPGGIWYTPQSGIWKSVWLEFVPEVYLERVTIEPDCQTNTVLIGCIAHKSDRVLREEIEGSEITVTLYEPTEHFVAPCDTWPDGTSVDKVQVDKAQVDKAQVDKAHSDKAQSDKAQVSSKQPRVGQSNGAYADNGWMGAELCVQSTILTKEKLDDALGGYDLGARDQTMSFVLDVVLEDSKRWSPEHPWIYPVKITFLDDAVWSYCAFRTAEIAADTQGVMRFYLNGEPYFVQGVLDQGYWSDGLMTAPADDALVYDIMAAKQAGFTMMRKHIKIEDDRWYYHCDRLGMLVWQDVPTGGGSYDMWSVNYKPTLWRRSWTHYRDDTVAHQIKLSSHNASYQAEWIATATNMVRRLSAHPSVVTWVLFNEGWGQFSAAAMTELIHKEDPTRPIDATSGWFDQQVSDYNSVHNYFRDYEVYSDDPAKLRGYAAQRGGRAFVVSEFGGVVYHDPAHSMYAEFYGYDVADSLAAFRQAVVNQIASMGALEQAGLAGFVYTQLSDVEEETNGILTYDRKVNKLQSDCELSPNYKQVLAHLVSLIEDDELFGSGSHGLCDSYDSYDSHDRVASDEIASDRIVGDGIVGDRIVSDRGVFASAPGRIELAGNHVDHQGGKTISAAFDKRCYALARLNGTNQVRMVFSGFGSGEIDLSDPAWSEPKDEERETSCGLVRGMIAGSARRGRVIRGFDLVTYSEIPVGRGVSSSAAFEVCVGGCVSALFDFEETPCNVLGKYLLDPGAIAHDAVVAERDYFGKPCGAQDQTASAYGSVLCLDFQTDPPRIQQVPYPLDDAGYVVCLIDSQCNHAQFTSDFAAIPKDMDRVAHFFNAERLHDVDKDTFLAHLSMVRKTLGDRPALRALHFFNEVDRVDKQVEALTSENAAAFLKNVLYSGSSSAQYLQNVVLPRSEEQTLLLIMALCDTLLEDKGAWRVHGGGFGGSVIAFVPRDEIESFCATMEQLLGGTPVKSGSDDNSVCMIVHVGGPGVEAFALQMQ